MTPEELARKADTAGLRLVRFLWCGNDGTIRAKASSRHGLEGRLERGIGVTRAMQAMNALDQLQPVEGYGPVGEFRLVPDLDTFRTLPYAPNTGVVLTDHVLPDGTPAGVCQRTFLKRSRRGCAERGLELRAAFENEFSLARKRGRRLHAGGHRPVLLDDRDGEVAGVRRRAGGGAGERSGSRSSSTTPSSATASRRCRPRTRPRVQAADEQVLVRETIRGVAAEQELVASLAPKPWPDERGQRRARALLAVGGRAQPLLRRGRAVRARASSSSPACSSICPACAG